MKINDSNHKEKTAREKRNYKPIKNNSLNGNNKFLPINNYLEYKQITLSNYLHKVAE
jgi:hypothetical protein